MNELKISVLLPFYNAAPFLEEAIRSILAQSFSDFELILIDDGSTDSSYALASGFSDKRIRLIKNDGNKGLIYSLNRGLELSKGVFIARMDADDICLPDRLECQYREMKNDSELMVCGSQVNYFGSLDGSSNLPLKDADLKASLLFNPCFIHPAVMFRASFIREHNITYSSKHIHIEDYDLWLRIFNLGKFMNLSKPLLNYRMGEQNITVKNKATREIRLKAMFAQVQKLLDIDCTGENLELHLELSHNRASIKNYRKLKSYIQMLLSQNKKLNVFDQVALEKLLDDKWKRIFYIAADQGFLQGMKYIGSGGHVNLGKLRYFFSRRVRK